MGWFKKTVNKVKNHAKKYLGDVGYNLASAALVKPVTTAVKIAELDLKGAAQDALSHGTAGLADKYIYEPQMPSKEDDDKPAGVDTAALAAAMDEEEEKRKKKRGFAANVFGSDFRFGGAAPLKNAVQNKTGGPL